MGRAEAFASKNNMGRSALDGLGMGLGYTLSLMALAAFREIIATGAITLYEKPTTLFGASFEPFRFLVEAPGAFVCLGLMLGIMNILGKK
jgi:electron transport complex protein RnfE